MTTTSSWKTRPANDDVLLATLRASVVDLCAHYLGGLGKTTGSSVVWRCPRCGKAKFEASATRAGGVAGCWNGACEVPTSSDAIGIAAYFEGLDRRREFPELLRRASEALGLDERSQQGETTGDGRRVQKAPQKAPRAVAQEHAYPDDPELRHAVYAALLARAPLDPRGRAFLKSRGLTAQTIVRGSFGSLEPVRAREAVIALSRRFGEEAILRVPGFFARSSGVAGFTLSGAPYVLIPYHDRRGNITTVEGRHVGDGPAPMDAKYLSLRGSGSHLYLFPGTDPDHAVAFTEGCMGAILAFQEAGAVVPSIKGIRCHRLPSGAPLPELVGTDLGGRTVAYIPDHDDPPKREVLEEAPKAARSLVGAHGGRPTLLTLPKGMDLDEWLLALPANRRARRNALRALLKGAKALEEPQTTTSRNKGGSP